tara:strand:- start:194 stop:1150 length:957 start_codon:yes stop_codon:yes gene_type:complete
MVKKLLPIILLSGVFFLVGILVGHYKPTAIQVPYLFLKERLINDSANVYADSVRRLNERSQPGSCSRQGNSYSFFVAGHVYGTPGSEYEGIYKPFKNNKKLNECSLLFGFLLGDTVVTASNYEFGILKDDLKSFEDNTKIYIAPGNHEVGVGSYNAKRDVYLENFGERTYQYLEYKNDLFIILDTNISNWNLSKDQVLMLKNLQSKQRKYENVFIFSHQLFWIGEENPSFLGLIPNSNEGRAKKLNFWKEVFPITQSIGKNLFFFAGDVGAFNNKSEFFYRNISEVEFFATGMGGGKRDNFMLVHIENEEVNIELVEF